MIRHVVLWQFKEDVSLKKRSKIIEYMNNTLNSIKEELLILQLDLLVDPIETSNADLMLDSVFNNIQHLTEYTINTSHTEMVDYVSKYLCNRMCFDYELS